MPGEDDKQVGPYRSLGQDLAWRLEAIAFAGFVGLMRLLGVERASNVAGWLVRRLGPKVGTHKTVMRNLRIAFPDMPQDERQALAVEAWERIGRSFAETAVMDQLTPASGRLEIVGAERLAAIRESGRPVVFVSGHLSNFEVMAAVLVDAVPVQITYRAANNPYVDAQIRAVRARYGVKLFAPKGGEGARELLQGLQRGESVALLNDQKFNEGPEVVFFGQPVNAAPGPSRLALKFGTVLQPVSVVRLPGVRFRVTIHEAIAITPSGDRQADIVRGVQAVTSFVEARVREHPVDWFWVHKRWPNRVYEALAEQDRAAAA